MALTPEQWELNKKRLAEHGHSKYSVDIDLGNGIAFKGLAVHPNVLRPEKTSALYFGRYLAATGIQFKNKDILDMGCGCGIQGLVAQKRGARKVVFSDISEFAVANTKENIEHYKLEEVCDVRRGDLFQNVSEKFDVILFNQPFFDEKPLASHPVSIAMFDEGKLIHRFFDDAKAHLKENGILIMPFFHFAGDTNDPKVQAVKHDYKIVSEQTISVDDANLQKGLFSVCVLKP